MATILQQGEYYGSGILSKDLGLFTLTVNRYSSCERIEKHYHEASYLSMALTGGYIEKSKEEDTAMPAGHVIFRPRLYDHANTFARSGGLCLNLELKNTDTLRDFFRPLPSRTTFFRRHHCISLFELYSAVLSQQSTDLLLEKAIAAFSTISGSAIYTSQLPWINRLCSILDHEPATHTLQSLSDRVCVHPVYMANAFRKKMGMTIGDYQLQSKMNRALPLLFDEKITVHEIATRSGFHDAAHFIKTFKFHFKNTPHQVKRLSQKLIRYNSHT